MAQWQAADAKQRFSELVEAAEHAGPQLVMRHKTQVAIVLSPDHYSRLVRQADANFANLLVASPLESSGTAGIGLALSTAG